MGTWRMGNGKRETPCCGVAIRVKIVEPGVQERKCEACRQTRYFVLKPVQMKGLEDRLRLVWVDEAEAQQEREAFDRAEGVTL